MSNSSSNSLDRLIGQRLFYLENNRLRFQVSRVNGNKCPTSPPETGRLRVEVKTNTTPQSAITSSFMGMEYVKPDISYHSNAIITHVEMEVDPALQTFIGRPLEALVAFLYPYQPLHVMTYGGVVRPPTLDFVLGRIMVDIEVTHPTQPETKQTIRKITVQV
jgi:hypothetical protein